MSDGHEQLPHRHERDPKALRAATNPTRLRLMELLAIRGSATATELAEEIDESPANCSWHLRQLAKYGYIEPAGGGKGRQHPWKLVATTRSAGGSDEPPELAEASTAMELALAENEYLAYQRWQMRARAEPPEWVDAAYSAQSLTFLTAEELTEIQREMEQFIRQRTHLERLYDPSKRPEGARLVRLFGWGVPG
jgi:DNA-binding transcriptional ArsR family regulator